MKNLFAAALILSTSTVVSASDISKSQISEAVQKNTPFKVTDVEESPIAGMYQVITEKGTIYASKDGKYLVSGSIHELKPGIPNLTQKRNLVVFKSQIDSLYNDFITYRAPNEKHEVIVFYDTSCGYCHKMHSQISAYNAQGITVHYAAFPRDGILANDGSGNKSRGFQALENIWCAENKNLAFNMVSRNADVPRSTCSTTIDKQYQLGERLGVRGTPAVFSLSGQSVMEGYARADLLKNRLMEMSL